MNRSYSPILQPLVNQSIQIFEIIRFSLEKDKIQLHIDITDGNELQVKYSDNGCLINDGDMKILPENRYIDAVISDFFMLIRETILIKQLIFGAPQNTEKQEILQFFEKFRGFFKNLNFPKKLNVAELNIEFALDEKELFKFLPYFSAGILENLNCRKINAQSPELAETEHWKQAKRLWIGDTDLKLADFLHFDWCSIEHFLVSEEEVAVLIENCLQKIPKFEQFSYIPIQPNGNSAVSQCMENYKKSKVGRQFNGYQLSIPGSKYYLNIDNGSFRVVIRKMEFF